MRRRAIEYLWISVASTRWLRCLRQWQEMGNGEGNFRRSRVFRECYEKGLKAVYQKLFDGSDGIMPVEENRVTHNSLKGFGKKRSRNIQCLLWLRQTMLSRHNRIKDESISRKKLSQHFHNINFNVALKGNLQVLQRSMGTSRVEKEHKHLFSIMLQTFSFTQHTSNEIIKQSLININLTWARVINRNITVLRNDWD